MSVDGKMYNVRPVR